MARIPNDVEPEGGPSLLDGRIRILHLEDDSLDAELVRAMLLSGNISCQIERVATREDYEERLAGHVHYDLILSDFNLPGYDGSAAMALARQLRPETPFILVSGTLGEDAAIESLVGGATDYVLKHRLARLVPAVRRALDEAQSRGARRRAEEAHRGSESLLKKILESVDEGFVVIDREFRLLAANRAYCVMVGATEEQLLQRRCYERSPHCDFSCWKTEGACPVRRTLENGEPHAALHTKTSADGAASHFEVKSFPMTDALGGVVSAIEIVNDVTEKRKLELQLRQAQKMEAIGALAAGVAHDFNNLLTAIVGYGELLRVEVAGDAPLSSLVEPILAAADRAAHLTRGLLAFGRKQPLAPKSIGLNGIVGHSASLLRRLIGEDIRLSTTLAETDPVVMADAGQIDQVLMNLATNARDAMPNGGEFAISTQLVHLDESAASARSLRSPGAYAMIKVSDTGTGMDRGTCDKIFEPFFTTKELGRGTGLGLAIVYGIINQHGGAINVSSELGQGTTFELYLPLVSDSSTEVAAAPRRAPQRGNETVLLAEDDRTVRELTGKVLRNAGYHVLEATDGEEAIELFRRHTSSIDLLISDVVMPKKSGREVYEAVTAMRPDVKVLFTSGYPADIVRGKGILDEGLNFASKPIRPQELLDKVREVLGKKD